MEKSIVYLFLKLKSAAKVQAWVLESGFVLAILLAVAVISGKGVVEYIAVAAVFYTFKHASVGERLREADQANSKKRSAETTSCAHKLGQFFVVKEVLWVAFFALSGSWSALAGCGIFLLYAWWRKAYRKYHPRATKPVERDFRRHFKYANDKTTNGCYEVLHLAEATETGELMVVYRPLYKLPDLHSQGVTALVRTRDNFGENLDGGRGMRFKFICDPDVIALCEAVADTLYKD